VEGTIPGVTAIDLEVTKSSKSSSAAICIPTEPAEIVCYGTGLDRKLRHWWETWSGNVVRSIPPISSASQLFFVVEKTETEQFANCYYSGKTSQTNFKLAGKVADLANISLEAGISCQATTGPGSWPFKGNVYTAGQKWTIFIKTEKLSWLPIKRLIAEAKRLWQ
jgi:hypothetical protein